MEENKTQNERLEALIEAFKKESVRYRDLQMPESIKEKQA